MLDRTSVGVLMMWQCDNPNATNKFTDVAPAVCGVASCVEDLASLRRSGKPLLGGEELYRVWPECSICVERPTLQSPASRAVAAFQRRADPLAAVFQLRRLCEHRSIPAEAGSSGASSNSL